MAESNLIVRAEAKPAPAWSVDRWFNAPEDFGLHKLEGRVIALHAFQMLCPGCVAHGIPQAQRIAATFDRNEVAVVGLHTVFEHHEAMRPVSLAAFLHEYGVSFPVGVDVPSENGPAPETMTRYRMRGTPSLVLIDRDGRLRYHAFGRPDDMVVGAAVQALVAEASEASFAARGDSADTLAVGCSSDACVFP